MPDVSSRFSTVSALGHFGLFSRTAAEDCQAVKCCLASAHRRWHSGLSQVVDFEFSSRSCTQFVFRQLFEFLWPCFHFQNLGFLRFNGFISLVFGCCSSRSDPFRLPKGNVPSIIHAICRYEFLQKSRAPIRVLRWVGLSGRKGVWAMPNRQPRSATLRYGTGTIMWPVSRFLQ